MNTKVLYIGGFELPDKNAAAQRVIGIAKGLRTIGHEVQFLNSIKNVSSDVVVQKNYYGFTCYEYSREPDYDYLFSGKTAIQMISEIKPGIIIAYNYPAVALKHIIKYCKEVGIRIYADATEWYKATKCNPIFWCVKNFDSQYRMRIVHKKTDGVIAISRHLYDYYSRYLKTAIIPPTVDISDEKWRIKVEKKETAEFVYAGSPSAQKERLDTIVGAIESIDDNNRVVLNVVGITKDQFEKVYNWDRQLSDRVIFKGRLSHQDTLNEIKKAGWAIIIRDNNSVVRAGFPTKVVESISCGTPVIVNRFSNIEDYLNDSNSVMLSDVTELKSTIEDICAKKYNDILVERDIFDYSNFLSELEQLLSRD